MNIWFVSLAAFAYLAILFLVAQWADRNAAQPGTLGERVFNSPLVYAIDCSLLHQLDFLWRCGNGQPKRAEFMAIYLGPNLVFSVGFFCLENLRISRSLRITSIADFISSRFGKVKASQRL